MEHQRLVQQVLDYIDLHIREELGADSLASLAGFSPAHFSRLFSSHMGLPVGDYIRRRRLLFALHSLQQGRRVIDVAMEYGFDTHAGFTKAVRRAFGCPPSVLRLHFPSGPPDPPSPPVPGAGDGWTAASPLLRRRESMKLAGYDMRSVLGEAATVEDTGRFWKRLRENGLGRRLLELEGRGMYGVSVGEWPGDDYTFLIGVQVNDFTSVPGDMRCYVVPGCECAVFRTPKETPERLAVTVSRLWRYVLEDWLPESGWGFDYQLSDMEAYSGDFLLTGAGDRMFADIYIPIMREKES